MLNKTLKNLFFAVSVTAFLFLPVTGQTPTPTPPPKPDDEGEVLRVTSTLVTVPVSVTDNAGQPVQGLAKTDFRIEEEGRPQQIEEIGTAEQVPLEIALLIDVSGSANKIFELEKNAAAEFLRSVMRADDRATIFLITDKPVLAQKRDTAENVAVKVRSIPATRSSTAFYDTVVAAAKYLRESAPLRSRRVILVLSDGEDNYSEYTRRAARNFDQNLDVNKLTRKDLEKRESITSKAHAPAQAAVLKELQNADTVFYSLNPSGPSVRLNVASQRAQNGLQMFADETGGTAFLPQFASEKNTSSFEQQNAAILERIFRQISAELRAQYLLQYYSETDFPAGRYVKLRVGLNNRPTLRIRSRQGYFAKNQ
ncbi:MAG: VWA domain-containing protein [Acidobacteriota bacterium]|nr:VWA domain-containing protein [Acidobacteriota bacterium]